MFWKTELVCSAFTRLEAGLQWCAILAVKATISRFVEMLHRAQYRHLARANNHPSRPENEHMIRRLARPFCTGPVHVKDEQGRTYLQ